MRNRHHPTRPFVGAVNTGRLSLEAGLAGLLGVATMLVVMQLAPLIGLPLVQLPYMLGYEMAGYALSGAMGQAMGWITVLAAGSALAVAYGWAVERWRPASGAGTGALLGLLTWLLVGVVFLPAVGLGVFARATGQALGVALATFLGCMAYGALTGALLKRLVRDSAQPVVRVVDRESLA